MKNTRLLYLLGDINEDYIAKAAPKNKKIKARRWVKWGAAAACFALILSIAIPTVMHFENSKELLEPIRIMKYNSAMYEIVEPSNKSVIKAYNLPSKITPDMIGEFVTPTTIEYTDSAMLYKYNIHTKNEQSAIYIVKEGNDYKFALFCNYLDNKVVSAQNLFEVYGIQNATDISSVTIKEPHKIRRVLSAQEDIAHFYNTLVSSVLMDEEQYQLEVFQRKSESEQGTIAKKLADECIEITIETTDGLVINHLAYNPSVGFASWALGHYKLAEAPF